MLILLSFYGVDDGELCVYCASISDACGTAVHNTSRIKKRVDGIKGDFLIQILVAERNCPELCTVEVESEKMDGGRKWFQPYFSRMKKLIETVLRDEFVFCVLILVLFMPPCSSG